MKKIIVFIICITGVFSSYSQDYIYKKDGTKIQAQNIQIIGKQIRYVPFGNRNAAVENLHIGYVSMIDYIEKGIEFYNEPMPEEPQSTNQSSQQNNYSSSSYSNVNRSDVIHTLSGQKISSKVLEITGSTVRYEDIYSSNQSVKNIPTNQIWKIDYKDGTSETFNVLYENAPISDNQNQLKNSFDQNLNNEYQQPINNYPVNINRPNNNKIPLIIL